MFEHVLYGSSSLLAFGACLVLNFDSEKANVWASFFKSDTNILALVNVLFASLFGLYIFITRKFFIRLTEQERSQMQDFLTKFIMIRVTFMTSACAWAAKEIVVWALYYAVIAFFHTILTISRERSLFLDNFNPSIAELTQHLVLIGSITISNIVMAATTLHIFSGAGTSVLLILMFENVSVLLACLKCFTKYGLRFASDQYNAEQIDAVLFHSEFLIDTLTRLITIPHLFHAWFFCGLSFSLSDFLYSLNLKSEIFGFIRQTVKFLNYRRTDQEIRNRYPDATAEELKASDDICAICRDRMESAKKLPCNHMYSI